MPTSYRILVTSFFERDVRRQSQKDKKVLKETENLKEISVVDPYNLTKKFDIKKLKGIKPGEGQFRIRVKE